MNGAIRSEFAYSERYEEGTQSPLETLEKKSGTCRDFALLFMEAARSLGFGARFVSGYLYDPAPCMAAPPCRARALPTPGPTSICRAPAGSNTTRPTG